MGLQDTMRALAASSDHVLPEETIQVVFGATPALGNRGLNLAVPKSCMFVVTDQRILILEVTGFKLKIKGVMAEIPRATRLGPWRGMTHTISVGEKYVFKVHPRNRADVQAADDLAGAVD